MNELFVLREGEKTASKDCIIRHYIDRESNIVISRKMDANLAFYVSKNKERIEKNFSDESGERTKTCVGIQGER